MTPSPRPARPGVVLKVGGSLLDWPDLPEALVRLLNALRRQLGPPIVIVGGGKFVDEIRRLDRIHQLTASPAHELAIRAMGLTAHLLPMLVPSEPWAVVQNDDELDRALAEGKVPVVAPWGWLAGGEPNCQQNPLPASWDTTSDSIAAHLAVLWDVPRVVLAKSASAPPPGDLRSAVAAGLVDPLLASQCEGRLSALGVCNLRRDPEEIHWLYVGPREPSRT